MKNTRGIGIQNLSPTKVAPSPYKSMDTNSFCDGLIDFQIPLVFFIRNRIGRMHTCQWCRTNYRRFPSVWLLPHSIQDLTSYNIFYGLVPDFCMNSSIARLKEKLVGKLLLVVSSITISTCSVVTRSPTHSGPTHNLRS